MTWTTETKVSNSWFPDLPDLSSSSYDEAIITYDAALGPYTKVDFNWVEQDKEINTWV